MKVGTNYTSFDVSSSGLSVQRKKMNVIAENIANAETTRTADGTPYKRKFMIQTAEDVNGINSSIESAVPKLKLNTNMEGHINPEKFNFNSLGEEDNGIKGEVLEDGSTGSVIFMPNHPDADENGYIETSNVNIVNEMVSMIEASRNYEANLTALKSSKEMIKDSLEI